MTDKPMTAMQGWRQIGVFAIGFIVLTAAVLWSPWNNLIDSVDALTIKVEHATQTMATPAPAWEPPCCPLAPQVPQVPTEPPEPEPDRVDRVARLAEDIRIMQATLAELKSLFVERETQPPSSGPEPRPDDRVDKLWDWASKTTERVNAKHEYFSSRIDRLEKALSQKANQTDQPPPKIETPPSYESRQVVPRYRTEGTPGVPGGDTYRPDQVPRMLIPQNTPR